MAVPAPAPVPAQPAPGSATDSPTIGLRFAIEPAGAAVELDGVFVTARQITVRKDSVPHLLRISAPGFAMQERDVRFDDSQKLVIQLRRMSPGAPARRAPVRPKIDSQSPYE